MNKIIDAVSDSLREDIPDFRSGDTVNVGVKVIEGNKTRVQSFEGVVIAISSGGGIDKTFTVRKISNGIGVERIFPYFSPVIESVKLNRRGKVKQARIFYMRERSGKSARIKERRI